MMGVPDITLPVWQRAARDELVRDVIRHGRRRIRDGRMTDMPASPDLKRDQVEGLYALVRAKGGR
jgi:mono/diheme cytochrome c family protein